MITIVFDAPGATTAQYDEACRLANVSQSNIPDGLVFHFASTTETGLLVTRRGLLDAAYQQNVALAEWDRATGRYFQFADESAGSVHNSKP